MEPPYDFAELRHENSVIETFCARREQDESGGEGGERVQSVRDDRPVFSLHLGKMRGATWFEQDRPPQGVVWLLSVEDHDERHKGSGDAYDLFAQQEAQGVLYPVEVDYKLLELSRRVRDTSGFEEEGRGDAERLLGEVISRGYVEGALANIPIRIAVIDEGDPIMAAVAVSQRPIIGHYSKLEIPLTQERFLLLARIVEETAAKIAGDALAEEPRFDFPGGLREERGFLIAFPRP